MASISRLSGFRDNETGDARANVQASPPPTFVNLVTIGSLTTHQIILAKLFNRILRYGDGGGGGLHVRTCRDAPPHPWLVESTYLMTPNPHTKFEHNRPNRSWNTEARCARAHVQRHPTHDLWEASSPWPPTHTPKLNSIGRAIPEIQKRGLHVRTCRDTPSMTCGKHLVHDSHLTHQNWTQSAEPFLRYRSAVCTCARAEIPHPWLLHKL